MDYSVLEQIPTPLLSWYHQNRRILPWREHPLPYPVWVSEIMLQQTRVEAVIPYFERFLTALPTIADLAQAPEDVLMKLWEGLGYYSRVRNLQNSAKIIVEKYGGKIPCDYDAVRALPGIGDYSAGAICSIAFGLPTPAVDGNVLRVLTRICADAQDVTTAKAKNTFRDLLRPLYPPGQCGDFTQALMELGATVCLPNGVPRCSDCPMQKLCRGFLAGNAQEYPVKPPKKARKIEERRVFLILSPDGLLLHRRPKKGLLSGMWELPNVLANDPLPFSLPDSPCDPLPNHKHIFSHIEWHMSAQALTLSESFVPPKDFEWVTLSRLEEEIALPGAFAQYRREAISRMRSFTI